MQLAQRRRQGELAEFSVVVSVATSGDQKAIKAMVKKLGEESQ